jgi:hypothetical protein
MTTVVMFVSQVVVRSVKCQPGVPEKRSEWELVLSERAQGTNLLYCTSRWMFKSRYYHFMTGVMDEGTILGASWPLVTNKLTAGT